MQISDIIYYTFLHDSVRDFKAYRRCYFLTKKKHIFSSPKMIRSVSVYVNLGNLKSIALLHVSIKTRRFQTISY